MLAHELIPALTLIITRQVFLTVFPVQHLLNQQTRQTEMPVPELLEPRSVRHFLAAILELHATEVVQADPVHAGQTFRACLPCSCAHKIEIIYSALNLLVFIAPPDYLPRSHFKSANLNPASPRPQVNLHSKTRPFYQYLKRTCAHTLRHLSSYFLCSPFVIHQGTRRYLAPYKLAPTLELRQLRRNSCEIQLRL